jgi:hypothetical protein
VDLFGFSAERPEFKDIRNQRESVAEEKARLCAELNSLLRRTPKPNAIASVQQVKQFQHAHKTALKVLQCKTSSRQELQSAITSMSAWHDIPSPSREKEEA